MTSYRGYQAVGVLMAHCLTNRSLFGYDGLTLSETWFVGSYWSLGFGPSSDGLGSGLAHRLLLGSFLALF